MTSLRRLRSGWRLVAGLFRRRASAERLDEELRFHVEMLTARHARAGLTPAAARRAALREFGGADRHAEAARDEYRSLAGEELVRDVRRTLRDLARTPVFTAAAVLTLALGISATTVVFSLVDHVVLRPLPYPDAERLVVVREVMERIRHAYPTLGARAPHYLAWRERCGVCEDVAALRPLAVTWTDGSESLRLGAVRTSANLFPLLGAAPLYGRLFHEAEDMAGGGDVVVLSHAFWQRQFGGARSVLGSQIRVNDRWREVIGILPPRFRLPKGDELGPRIGIPSEPELFLPLALSEVERTSGGGHDYVVLARLLEGVEVPQATLHIGALQRALGAAHTPPLELGAALLPLQAQVVGAAGRPLGVLLAAVGAVLLLVCVNLANLLLARNTERARAVAVRAALGARRGRLVREALTESVVLACVAGALSLVLSYWGLAALLQLAPADLPRLHEVRLDARVAGVALALAAVTGLVFGVLPAVRSAAADPGEVLRAGGRAHGGDRGAARARGALIASQIALTTVLLVTAGLFLASFVRVLGLDRGFREERVLAVDIFVPSAEYTDPPGLLRLYARVLEELHATPGVAMAAATSRAPLEGFAWSEAVAAEGDTRPSTEWSVGELQFVTDAYFATLGIPLASGRAFADADRGRDAVVLSANLAERIWPGADAIGRRVQLGRHLVATVVGVAANVATAGLEAEPGAVVYLPPWTAFGFPNAATILVRSEGDPAAIAGPARAALRRASAGTAVAGVRTMNEVVAAASAARRFQLLLLAAFAATALVTACVGIFGVVAHSLGRRRAEIGVRVAFGARRANIHRLVLREAGASAAIGLAVGLALGLATGRALESLLFQVRPAEPAVLAAVATLLAAVTLLAAYVPARRASAVAVTRALGDG